jgi:preprotein translocase SecE subunit
MYFAERAGARPLRKRQISCQQKLLQFETREFKKVIWPNKKNLSISTVRVIIASLFIGLVIVSMDSIYGYALRLFSAFVTR